MPTHKTHHKKRQIADPVNVLKNKLDIICNQVIHREKFLNDKKFYANAMMVWQRQARSNIDTETDVRNFKQQCASRSSDCQQNQTVNPPIIRSRRRIKASNKNLLTTLLVRFILLNASKP